MKNIEEIRSEVMADNALADEVSRAAAEQQLSDLQKEKEALSFELTDDDMERAVGGKAYTDDYLKYNDLEYMSGYVHRMAPPDTKLLDVKKNIYYIVCDYQKTDLVVHLKTLSGNMTNELMRTMYRKIRSREFYPMGKS